MQFTLLALTSFAAVALAQTTASTGGSSDSACAAQNIVDACKATIDAQIASCQANDWRCLCEQHTNLLTCYNNCPGDPVRSSVNNQVLQYCAAASQYSSTTAVNVASTAAAQATTTAASGTGAATPAGSSTAAPTNTPNAAPALELGGSLAIIALAGLGLIA